MATPTKNEVANKKNNVDNNIEILRVQPTNNPGMTLVSNPFNGTSFLAWSRLVRITLGAKMELGYINSKILKPSEDSKEFEQWNRANYMVTSWLLNSISKDIVESFLYVNSARELWQELETRFRILMMDPLSSVTKAYAMVLHVEKQREVSSGITGATQNMAMQNPIEPDLEEFDDYAGRDHDPVTCTLPVIDDVTNDGQDDFPNTITRISIEPKTFQQANRKQEWVKAMKSEIDALEQNYTWEVTPLPKDKRDIECRWIFKLKLKSHGTIGRQKVRLVAKGYNQIEGIDYFDTFSPVAKAVTVRTLLVVAASLQWHIHQVDINNAFLHGYIEEEVYMMPPKGYSVPPGHVSKLRRSLYGLKHISRQWNVEFTSKLETYGFHQSKHDHCLYTKSGTSSIMLLLVYVDVILLAGPSEQLISEVKLYLHKEFTIKDLGAVRYFLGLEISRSREGI
ncbi:UNVERIFIED_CONTAM: Retrovirus-related Pol polyprotein from transposon TNT 1-94 [Sesamum calycinum]|uniref:Retrovirus-related Pol polyprotein from transposon TNT 1-94 n=1 Tax=Sesamum calycinum TaxID=2727403 RepID=A0AAW2J358_9LAMI